MAARRKPASGDRIPPAVRAALQFLVLLEDLRNPPREFAPGRELTASECGAESAALVLLTRYFAANTPKD